MLKTYSEQHIQIGIVHHFRKLAKSTRTFWLFHVYNGGPRPDKSRASLLRALGVYAGVPDLIFLAKGGRIIFIEIKAHKKYLSKKQKAFARMLKYFGFPFYIISASNQEEGINKTSEVLIKELIL